MRFMRGDGYQFFFFGRKLSGIVTSELVPNVTVKDSYYWLKAYSEKQAE